jgi:glycerophosphoryl diester phosphodiesterase family protein
MIMSKHSCFLGLGIVVLMIVSIGCDSKQNKVLLRAHAHNDYEHDRPLLDALDHGFCSVEVDVHLVADDLLVAHDADEVRPGRTIQALYLDPLRQRVRENKGRVYREGPVFLLWIDVKTNGPKTYAALHRVLQQYEDMLTVVRAGKIEPAAIQVIISGNRVPKIMRAQPVRYAGMDGRLSDIDSDVPVHFMPWISDKADKISRWKGDGPVPQADIEKLRRIARNIHKKGRKMRLWGTPENIKLWETLLEAGVDIINTDDLGKLRAFLLSRSRNSNGTFAKVHF